MGQVWQARVLAGRSAPRRLALVLSDAYDDGARVDLELGEFDRLGDDVLCTATFDSDDRVVALDVAAHRVPKAAPMYWVELSDNDARPPAVVLQAHDAAGEPAGRLTTEAPLPPLGWVRWYPMTGLLEDIWVQPDRRRTGVATALLYAADTLSAARAWQRLWADGQRTDLADRLRDQDTWRDRAADRTHTAQPE